MIVYFVSGFSIGVAERGDRRLIDGAARAGQAMGRLERVERAGRERARTPVDLARREAGLVERNLQRERLLVWSFRGRRGFPGGRMRPGHRDRGDGEKSEDG